MMKVRVRFLIGTCLLGLTNFTPAHAQEGSTVPVAAAQRPAADPPSGSSGGLEEIVVTAQRREERLQDVPIAVSAVTATTLENSAVTSTEALAASIPGLTFNQTAGAGVPVIRGIGSSNVVLGDESSVATYVDGVYRPFRAGNIFALNNVDRVEVLKGPQGALFGRNATGGVIQIITRAPTEALSYDFRLGYDNFETLLANGYVSGGLAPGLAADLAIYFNDQNEGWGRNLSLNRDAYFTREFAARSKLQWTASDTTTLTLGADYNSSRFDVPYRLLGSSVALDGSTRPARFYDVRTSYPAFLDTEQFVGSLTIDHDFRWANLRSISSFQRFEGSNTPDNDVTALPILNARLDSTGRAFTQEVQLSSPSDSKIGWIVGGFFMSNKAGNESVRLSGLALQGLGLQFTDTRAIQKTTSYSAFGQVSVPLTDQFTITGGVRYTRDEQRLNFGIGSDLGPLGSGTAKESFGRLSPRVVLEYRPTQDVMVYASYNGGFKSGLFNTVEPSRPVVRPEKLDAFEVGIKSQFFDNRVRFNLAGYYYDYSDFQVLQVIAASTVLLNAGVVEIYGLDADLEWAVTDALTLRGGLSLIKGEYKEFDNAPISTSNTPLPGNTITGGNAAGNDITRAPKKQIIVGGTYEFSKSLNASVNFTHTGAYPWEPDNRLRQRSVNMFNGTINWQTPDESFGVQLWARNLLDEKYNVFATALPFGDIGQAGAPRTFGVTVRVRN